MPDGGVERDLGRDEVVGELDGRRIDVPGLEHLDEDAVALDLFCDVAPDPVEVGQAGRELGAIGVGGEQALAPGETDERPVDLEMGFCQGRGVQGMPGQRRRRPGELPGQTGNRAHDSWR